jgi:hypothetical protein
MYTQRFLSFYSFFFLCFHSNKPLFFIKAQRKLITYQSEQDLHQTKKYCVCTDNNVRKCTPKCFGLACTPSLGHKYKPICCCRFFFFVKLYFLIKTNCICYIIFVLYSTTFFYSFLFIFSFILQKKLKLDTNICYSLNCKDKEFCEK